MNDALPMVSVIIRTKDRPEMLMKAVNSVLAQDYRPLELVVVNDGGIDVKQPLLALLKCKENVSLHYLQHRSSLGRAQAANRGLIEASGELSIFLDDDDYFDSGHLSSLVHVYQQSFNNTEKLEAVHCRARAVQIDEDGSERTLSSQGNALREDLLYYQNSLPILTVLFPTEVRELGIQFDDQFDLFEDWDFWLQVSAKCHFKFVDQVTCAYRIHNNSSGVREYDKQTEAYQKVYAKWLKALPYEKLSRLMAMSHIHHDQIIASLQALNQQQNQIELDRIGKLHEKALNRIKQQDLEVSKLNEALAAARREIYHIKRFSLFSIGKRCLCFIYNKWRHFFARTP